MATARTAVGLQRPGDGPKDPTTKVVISILSLCLLDKHATFLEEAAVELFTEPLTSCIRIFRRSCALHKANGKVTRTWTKYTNICMYSISLSLESLRTRKNVVFYKFPVYICNETFQSYLFCEFHKIET